MTGVTVDQPFSFPDLSEADVRRFWSVLAVQLGKRAGLVSIIGLLVTMIMAFGLTRLEFATGQDERIQRLLYEARFLDHAAP